MTDHCSFLTSSSRGRLICSIQYCSLTMEETSAFSSPLLGDQIRKSRKSRITTTMRMAAIAVVLAICAFGQVFNSVQILTDRESELVGMLPELQVQVQQVSYPATVLRGPVDTQTPQDSPVSMNMKLERAGDGTVSLARATLRRQVNVDISLPAAPVLREEIEGSTTAASATTEAQSMIPNPIVSIAVASTALVFSNTESKNAHSQSSLPQRGHAKHSHAAVTVTIPLSHTNAKVNNNKTLSHSEEPPRPHPHAGARDAEGNWGYVADVTRIRRWMLQRYRKTAGLNATMSSSSLAEAADEALPPSSYLPLTVKETEYVCGREAGKGIEGEHGWDVVIKVVLDGPNPLPLANSDNIPTTRPEPNPKLGTDQNSTKSSSVPHVPPKHIITTPEANGVSKGKILCGIYTYDKMDYRIHGISETWGWRCDGFLPASTVTIDDPAIRGYGSVDVPHLGPEKYSNMWQKTRSILAYMYDNYFDDYEYFYLAGDDTHLIVENLRRYLYTVEQTHDVATEPLYMGMPYTYRKILHNIGGSGYVLNRMALKRLVLEAFPICHAKNQVSAEDRFVGKCFESMQIKPLHSADAQGRQRFLHVHPNDIGKNRGMKVYYKEWGRKYGWRTGADVVSESSITFHMFRSYELMKRHHAIIYNSCPAGTVLHAAVQKGRDARRNSTVAVVARR